MGQGGCSLGWAEKAAVMGTVRLIIPAGADQRLWQANVGPVLVVIAPGKTGLLPKWR